MLYQDLNPAFMNTVKSYHQIIRITVLGRKARCVSFMIKTLSLSSVKSYLNALQIIFMSVSAAPRRLIEPMDSMRCLSLDSQSSDRSRTSQRVSSLSNACNASGRSRVKPAFCTASWNLAGDAVAMQHLDTKSFRL